MVRALTSDESRREDAELIAHILARISEGEAQRRLVEKYWQLLVAWVRPRVADPSQAEDVAQETFLRAFKALDRLEDPRRFVPWLLKISTNRAADLRRRRRDQSLERFLEERGGQGGIPAPGVDLGEELDRQEDYRSVLAAVDRLPEKYRLVIMLRYFEGLTGNQIASALGEPEGTVRNRLFRAHARIRRILRDFCEKGRGSTKPAGKG